MAESLFVWTGRNRSGQTVRGTMQAPSRAVVEAHLQRQRIRPLRVHRPWPRPAGWMPQPKVRSAQVTQLTRQWATLLRAGVPLLQALEILRHGAQQTALHDVLLHLQRQLEAGAALHQAMRQHPAFDGLFSQLVAVGETAGMLDTVLERLAAHREKSDALKTTLRSALLYPCVVLAIALIVTALLLSFVVPTFEGLFTAFGADLPALTRGVIALSQFWQQHGAWLVPLLLALPWAVLQLIGRRPAWQAITHAWVLRLPIAGRLTRNACLARWTRTLATLFTAGVPLAEALEVTLGVTGNLHYQAATRSVQAQLMQGRSLAHALAVHAQYFPSLVVQMCAIGMESDSLDQMLNHAADHYESEVDALASQLATLLEPFMMVVLGALIGGLVLALYMPIFQMGQVV